MDTKLADHLVQVSSNEIAHGVLKSIHSDVRQCLYLSRCLKVNNCALVSQYNIKRCEMKAQCVDSVGLLEDWGYTTLTNYGHVKRGVRGGLSVPGKSHPAALGGGSASHGVLLDLDANHCLKERLCAYDTVNLVAVYLVVCKVSCRRVDKIPNRIASIEKPFSLNHDCRVLDSSCSWGFEHLDYIFCYDYLPGRTLRKKPRQVLPCYVVEFLVDWKKAQPAVARWIRQKMDYLLRPQEKTTAPSEGGVSCEGKPAELTSVCTKDSTISRTAQAQYRPSPKHKRHHHFIKQQPSTPRLARNQFSHYNESLSKRCELPPVSATPGLPIPVVNDIGSPHTGHPVQGPPPSVSPVQQQAAGFLETAPCKGSPSKKAPPPLHLPPAANHSTNHLRPPLLAPHPPPPCSDDIVKDIISIESDSEDDDAAWQVPGESVSSSPSGFESDTTMEYTFSHDELNDILAEVQAKLAARQQTKCTAEGKQCIRSTPVCDGQRAVCGVTEAEKQEPLDTTIKQIESVAMPTRLTQTIRLDASGKIMLIDNTTNSPDQGRDPAASLDDADEAGMTGNPTGNDVDVTAHSVHRPTDAFEETPEVAGPACPLDIDSIMDEVFGPQEDPVEEDSETQGHPAIVPAHQEDGVLSLGPRDHGARSPILLGAAHSHQSYNSPYSSNVGSEKIQTKLHKMPHELAKNNSKHEITNKSQKHHINTNAMHYVLTNPCQKSGPKCKNIGQSSERPIKVSRCQNENAKICKLKASQTVTNSTAFKQVKKVKERGKLRKCKTAASTGDADLPDIKPVKCWRQRTGLGMTPRMMLLATPDPQKPSPANITKSTGKPVIPGEYARVQDRKRQHAVECASSGKKTPRLSGDLLDIARRDSADSNASLDACKRSDYVSDTSENETESSSPKPSTSNTMNHIGPHGDTKYNIIGELTIMSSSSKHKDSFCSRNLFSTFHVKEEWYPPPPVLQKIPCHNTDVSLAPDCTLSPPKLIPIRDLEKRYSINRCDNANEISVSSPALSSTAGEGYLVFSGDDKHEGRTENEGARSIHESPSASSLDNVHTVYQSAPSPPHGSIVLTSKGSSSLSPAAPTARTTGNVDDMKGSPHELTVGSRSQCDIILGYKSTTAEDVQLQGKNNVCNRSDLPVIQTDVEVVGSDKDSDQRSISDPSVIQTDKDLEVVGSDKDNDQRSTSDPPVIQTDQRSTTATDDCAPVVLSSSCNKEDRHHPSPHLNDEESGVVQMRVPTPVQLQDTESLDIARVCSEGCVEQSLIASEYQTCEDNLVLNNGKQGVDIDACDDGTGLVDESAPVLKSAVDSAQCDDALATECHKDNDGANQVMENDSQILSIDACEGEPVAIDESAPLLKSAVDSIQCNDALAAECHKDNDGANQVMEKDSQMLSIDACEGGPVSMNESAPLLKSAVDSIQCNDALAAECHKDNDGANQVMEKDSQMLSIDACEGGPVSMDESAPHLKSAVDSAQCDDALAAEDHEEDAGTTVNHIHQTGLHVEGSRLLTHVAGKAMNVGEIVENNDPTNTNSTETKDTSHVTETVEVLNECNGDTEALVIQDGCRLGNVRDSLKTSDVCSQQKQRDDLETKDLSCSKNGDAKLCRKEEKKIVSETKTKCYSENGNLGSRPEVRSHLDGQVRHRQRASIPRSRGMGSEGPRPPPVKQAPCLSTTLPPSDLPPPRFLGYREKYHRPYQRAYDPHAYTEDYPAADVPRRGREGRPHRPRVTIVGPEIVYYLSELVDCSDFPTLAHEHPANSIRDMPFSDVVVVVPSVDLFVDPADYCIRAIGASLQAISDACPAVQIILCGLWHLPGPWSPRTDEVNHKVDRVNGFIDYMGRKYGHLYVLKSNYSRSHFNADGIRINQYGVRCLSNRLRKCLRETTSYWGHSLRNEHRLFDTGMPVR